MGFRGELLLTVGLLVALNLLIAFGAIGLQTRMGPAIERILEDNVASITDAEAILSAFAEHPAPPLPQTVQETLTLALQRIGENVTEQSEEVPLQTLQDRLPPAMATGAHRAEVVRALNDLIAVNRTAMQSVDQEAQRLSRAGAWTAVLVGFLSFGLSIVVLHRFQARLVRPLIDLHDVLEAARRGDRQRRCRLSAAPTEIRKVTRSVNRLLDFQLAFRRARHAATQDRDSEPPKGQPAQPDHPTP